MFLWQLFQNALLDPIVLKSRVNRLLKFSFYLIIYVLEIIIIVSIIYIICVFIVNLFSVKKYESLFWKGMHDWNRRFFSLLHKWFLDVKSIITTKIYFSKIIIILKSMLIWSILIACSWFIVSLLFSAGTDDASKFVDSYKNYYTNYWEYGENKKLINQWILLPETTLLANHEYLWYILGFASLYVLILIIIGSFIYTFSFGNKFVQSIAIVFFILGIFMFLALKLLNYYYI